jgi:hypothetical protein
MVFRKSLIAAPLLASLFSLACQSSFAAQQTPYVCEPTEVNDGAESRWVNDNGGLLDSLITSAEGADCAGLEITSLKSELSTNSLILLVKGTMNSRNGPWLYVTGTDQNGNTVTGNCCVTDGTVLAKTTGNGEYLSFSKNTFGFAHDQKVKMSQLVIQLFPSAEGAQTNIAIYSLNDAVPTRVLKSVTQCPVSSTAP